MGEMALAELKGVCQLDFYFSLRRRIYLPDVLGVWVYEAADS